MFPRERIEACVHGALEEVNAGLPEDQRIPADPDTRLVGREASLDSMGLVQFLVSVEQRINEELDIAVAIADERSMSRSQSPFRTIATLTDYAHELAEEQADDR